ncbi:MAG: HD domain-containing protein [Actinomycetota bacterium]|nr:HD domain-containing protein [Actinomycetota bacterium]
MTSFRCGNCGQFAGGGVGHRCPAPNLVEMTAAARAVTDACERAGGRPLIVGGSVRDALLAAQTGIPQQPKDIDIEVYGTDTDSLVAELADVGRVDEVGKSFGVLKVRVGAGSDAEDFDVSLPRRDSKTGIGHRGFAVEVDHDLSEVDAFGRRDFTVNAMGWDPATQELVDPYGGSADLADRVLRHTTAAFAEDPLRVLRGVQFAGRFDMIIAPETAELCRELVPAFDELPAERIWGEFAKIATKARRPSRSLQALNETGWEQHFPELAAVRGVPQDPAWHPEGPVHVHLGLAADAAAAAAAELTEDDRTVVVLAAMLHDLGKATHTDLGNPAQSHGPGNRITSHGHAEAGVEPVYSFLRRIGAPERYATKIGPIIREHMAVASVGKTDPSPTTVRRMMRRLAEPNGQGPGLKLWAAVVAADHAGRGPGSGPSPADAWLRVADELGETADRPRPGLLTGAHLIAAGHRPSPEFKPILAAALSAQDDGAFDDEVGALTWLRSQSG